MKTYITIVKSEKIFESRIRVGDRVEVNFLIRETISFRFIDLSIVERDYGFHYWGWFLRSLLFFSREGYQGKDSLKYLWFLSIVHDKIHLIEVNYLPKKSKILMENLLNLVWVKSVWRRSRLININSLCLPLIDCI